jgi:hypothetical protein
MKLSICFAAFGLLSSQARATEDVIETVTQTSSEVIVDLSFGGSSRRGLQFQTTPDPDAHTISSFLYDLNESNNCGDGGVCGSNYQCFELGPHDIIFSNPTTTTICQVDIIFFSGNCANLTDVPLSINDIDIGAMTDYEESCLCGSCDENSFTTTESDVLDSINSNDGGNVLLFTVNGEGNLNYPNPLLCLDRIRIDLHTNCGGGTKGDPHFKTWGGEHYEYHGQCDMVLASDPEFAGGLGLDVQIRTKLVRFWSYVKNAVVRIGDDILEVEGSGEPTKKTNYWVNFEYRGELKEIGGFPVTNVIQNEIKHHITIDLSSKYPNQKIHITTLKEFVRVDFENGTSESFGKTVGMMGNFKTGSTLARDGVTVLDDFSELGREWQLLPSDTMLFHNVEAPQFPEKCLEPEDPQGARRRRLAESSVTEEQAEAACALLKDPLDRKDCIYDILATQDLDMAGAY